MIPLLAMVGFCAISADGAAPNPLANTSSGGELAILAGRSLVKVTIRYEDSECEIINPGIIEAIRVAAHERNSQQASHPLQPVIDSKGATMEVFASGESHHWAMILVPQMPGSKTYLPAKIGSAWVAADSLLARIVGAIVDARILRRNDAASHSDPSVTDGFSTAELERIGSDKVKRIASKYENSTPGASAPNGSCCRTNSDQNGTQPRSDRGNLCSCGDACGVFGQTSKSNSSHK